MPIHRIVPNVPSRDPDLCRDFYVGFLGLESAMDMGWIATYVSPTHPKAQLTVLRADGNAPPQPAVSIEVDDVDRLHDHAVALGLRIVYPLTDEPWGVHRFWVEDPNGMIINILEHQDRSAED